MQRTIRDLMKQRLGQKQSRVGTNKAKEAGINSLSRVKSVRTRTVEAIQKQHTQHRNSHMAKIKKQQTQRRNSVQARVAARKKAKQSNALVQCAIFSDVAATSIATIIDKMEFEVVGEGVPICVQGDVADMFYLIMSGACQVLINNEIVATLNELQVFGESALFTKTVGSVAMRGATVETVRGGGDVQLLRLSKEKFDTLLASGTLTRECVQKIEMVAKERELENRLKASVGGGEGALEGEGEGEDDDAANRRVRVLVIKALKSKKTLRTFMKRADKLNSGRVQKKHVLKLLSGVEKRFGVVIDGEAVWLSMIGIGRVNGMVKEESDGGVEHEVLEEWVFGC